MSIRKNKLQTTDEMKWHALSNEIVAWAHWTVYIYKSRKTEKSQYTCAQNPKKIAVKINSSSHHPIQQYQLSSRVVNPYLFTVAKYKAVKQQIMLGSCKERLPIACKSTSLEAVTLLAIAMTQCHFKCHY